MSDEMMTLDEIELATINPDVAREAMTQTQLRLEDALATKASHEQKAFALLTAYTTIALAVFAGYGLLVEKNPAIAPAFFVVGVMYTFGAVLSAIALLPFTYGAVGSDPSAWLRRGVIDGGSAALPASLAYQAFFHRQRIEASVKSNNLKAHLIRGSIIVGVVALIVLPAWLGG